MPGKVAVKIKAGRNLPVMDRSSDTTDAYVEIKLGTVTQKTDVCRKTLNPQWNTDWFRFEVDDAELQDEPLQIRLMDHDTYSANDAIGKVNISLNPLCLDTLGQSTHGKGAVLSGWIPVFDTMHGIRGEVNVIVKVDLFSDLNKFRQSSCGIPFFHSQCIPHGYRAQVIHGFVEELVVNDDPEYQWIDKIRTPRASNEARQVVFLKLSGQVQRKMGLKAINMGANAVIGYTQCFDLEGDVGVVARGIGTAVTLIKDMSFQPVVADNALIEERTLKYLEFLNVAGVGLPEQPEYRLQIIKSDSSTSFNLKRASAEEEDSDVETMHDLLRQEDERGEKPAKKLKHRMRRLTHSSRNIFNEKYIAFKRKISDVSDPKLREHTSRSLSSLLMSSFIKEESSSVHSSMQDVCRQSFKAKHKRPTPTKPFQRESLMKMTHPIIRSISDDTAMKYPKSASQVSGAHKSSVSKSTATAEYQDSTRSSPNISSGQHQLRFAVNGAPAVSNHHPFGQFSKHAPHLLRQKHYNSFTLKSSTSSLTLDSSSSSHEEEESKLDISAIESDSNLKIEESTSTNFSASIDKEREKVNRILKICSLEHEAADKWIQPGQLVSVEDSLSNVGYRHSLLHDLKAFSQHIQELVHKRKKAGAKIPTMSTTAPCRTPPKTLAMNCFSIEQRKSYYSSQPEILNECDAYTPAPTSATRKLTRSCSLMDLTKLPAIREDYAFCANIAQPIQPALPAANFPLLQICPSTPTPSESELSPSELKFLVDSYNVNPSMLTSVESRSPKHPTLSAAMDSVHLANLPQSPVSTTDSSSICLNLRSFYLNANVFTNQNINMNRSMLVPFTSTAPLHIKTRLHHHSHNQRHQHHHRHQHRSLNEINVSSATGSSTAVGAAAGGISAVTDSPSMKRFASAASAAVVAAGAASGPISGSRSKLSPSPSKMGMTGPTSSQADSVSSATTSTATTMIPKDVSEMCRRSSDSDLSVTPKGNSICVASDRLVAATALMRLSQPLAGKSATAADSLDMLEYPFLTMTKYPGGFILHLGATVAARSVKLLERVPNPDEPEVRDSWWTELRMEIRSHARALGCNVVLGYSESTTISDDVCVLSATGTAAVINMAYNRSVSQTDIMITAKSSLTGGVGGITASLEERDMLKDVRSDQLPMNKENTSSSYGTVPGSTSSASKKTGLPPLNVGKIFSCTMCHIPYSLTSVPFNVKMKKCAVCRKGRVPDVLLATLEVPEHLQVTGRGCFMQAQVVRAKKDLRSELNAKEISDGLPFLEYELHRLLINKLKAKGMNAIFGLKAQVAIGERMIALIATGTALFLSALPVPQVPKIVAGNSWTDKQKLNELQKKLQETFERNQEIYQLKSMDPDLAGATASGAQLDKQSDTDESDDEVIEIDLNCGNKDTCVLEVDDIEDLEIISLLMEPYPPEGFHVVNTQMVPGMLDMEAVKNLQMFTQVWRAKLDVNQNISGFPKHFQRLLQTIYFKLRSMIPCAICDLRFRLDLPESDQIQLLVTGMALGLGDASKFKYRRKTMHTNGFNSDSVTSNISQAAPDANGTMHGQKRMLQEEDYIFPLDEDQMVETPTPTSNLPPYGTYSLKLRKTSPSRTTSKANAAARNRYFPVRDRYGIDITPLSFIPGGKIEKYLGNLNFFFIRESTSIRENGGISGFVHGFITELLAVVRAHIATLGGNAMVSFNMTELILVDNQHKNQGQCLISIGGDAVYLSYNTDDYTLKGI